MLAAALAIAAVFYSGQERITLLEDSGMNCVKAEYTNGNAATYCRYGDTFRKFILDATTAEGNKVKEIKTVGECDKRIYKEGDTWVYDSCIYPYSDERFSLEKMDASLRKKASRKDK